MGCAESKPEPMKPGMSVLAQVGAVKPHHSRSSSLTRSVTDRNGLKLSMSRTPPSSRGRAPVKPSVIHGGYTVQRAETMRSHQHRRAISFCNLDIKNAPGGNIQISVPVFDDFKKPDTPKHSPKTLKREPSLKRLNSLEVPSDVTSFVARERASTDERRKQKKYHEINHNRTPSFQAELDMRLQQKRDLENQMKGAPQSETWKDGGEDQNIAERQRSAMLKSQQFQGRTRGDSQTQKIDFSGIIM